MVWCRFAARFLRGKKNRRCFSKRLFLWILRQDSSCTKAMASGKLKLARAMLVPTETYRYLVLDSGVQVNSVNYDAVIQLPITQVVLTSTTQVPHLDALGQTDLLVGFPQLDLISSRAARQRIAAGKVQDLGSGPSANPELVLDLQPDWIMISTLGEDLRYLEVFKQAGIPALINGEYVEQNPLGRAEWIKFTGVLLGKLCGGFGPI